MFKRIILVVLTLLSFGSVSADTGGTIAYIPTNGDEIRLVNPDGSDNRAIWSNPNPDGTTINDIGWNADGSRLALSSSHEIDCSLYNSDIFSISPQGSNLQRITNNPACAALASYPKGSVEVTFRNSTLHPIDAGILIGYVQGASASVHTSIGFGGSSVTLLFNDVADMGDRLQPIVAKRGLENWLDIAGVNVIAGQTVQTTITLDARNARNYSAGELSWHPNGSEIGFVFDGSGNQLLSQISADPAIAEAETFITANGNLQSGATLAWSPTGRYIAYTRIDGIYVVDTANPAADAVRHVIYDQFDNYFIGVDWLPDESGFVFAFTQGPEFDFPPQPRTAANIFQYKFSTQQVTQLTQHNGDGNFAVDPKVSPDGSEIVYSFQSSNAQFFSIYRMPIGGGAGTLVAQGGFSPVWTAASIPNTPTAVQLSSFSLGLANHWLLAIALFLSGVTAHALSRTKTGG